MFVFFSLPPSLPPLRDYFLPFVKQDSSTFLLLLLPPPPSSIWLYDSELNSAVSRTSILFYFQHSLVLYIMVWH